MGNQVIYKYPLALVDCQKIMLPDSYEILTVKLQQGEPQLWVKQDNDLNVPNVEVKIWMYGTGAIIKETSMKYIGTILLCNDALVFHFFQTPAGQGK